MEKSNPFLIASMAFVAFFIVYIILKYLLINKIDILSALIGGVLFCIVVFLVHQLMSRRSAQ
jgi:uncharacterized membrane protein (GlpM family)